MLPRWRTTRSSSPRNEVPYRRAIAPALCGWLRERGHVADHVSQLGMAGASDAEIADWAETNTAVLVTKDEDFVTIRLPDRFVLLWLRCGNATNQALAAWLEPRWDQIMRLLYHGERFVEVR